MSYKVNIYKNSYDAKTLNQVDLITFLTTDKYKDKVEAHRKFLADGGNKKESPFKRELPAITVSGTFNEFKYNNGQTSTRCRDGLDEYNSLICIDIDGIDDVDETKAMLRRYSNVMFLAKSASGDGLFAVVKLDCKEDKHLDAFFKLKEFFKDHHDIEIDDSCKDITRLRFATYDDDYYYNPDATPMSVPIYMKEEQEVKVKKNVVFNPTTAEDAEKRWINTVDKFQSDFVQGNGWRWLTVRVHEAINLGVSRHVVLETILQLSDSNESDRWIEYHVNKLYAKKG